MTSRHDSGTSRDATAMPYIGEHRQDTGRRGRPAGTPSSYEYGTCDGCGKRSALRADGLVIAHGSRGAGCPGSGKPPRPDHRQCARCTGYIDAASGFYEVTRFSPYKDGAAIADGDATLSFDGLDCLAAYASAQDEAFPVRDRKQLVAPHVYRLCDWCNDFHRVAFGEVILPAHQGSCNHPGCQCWCGGT